MPKHPRARRAVLAALAVVTCVLASAGTAAAAPPPSVEQLTRVKEALDRIGTMPQTAWGIDTVRRQVVVTVQQVASPEIDRRVRAAAAEHSGGLVRVETAPGRLDSYVDNGGEITNGRGICSNGFNVRRGGQKLLLTAGHCTADGGSWNGGEVVASDFPTEDSGLIENASGVGPGRISTGQAITGVGTARAGQVISKTGRTTGTTSGPVVAVDQTVNFDEGTVYHEFGALLHSEPGDSGGPAYAGGTGLGTLSGGNAFVTYFYPLDREVADYGVTLAPADDDVVSPPLVAAVGG